ADFQMLYEEEKANIGSTEVFDYTKWQNNTDWIDALTQTGNFTTSNISVTQGTDRNRFYMGFGYTKDEGIVIHEKLEKFQLSLADEMKLAKNFKLGFNLAGSRTRYPNDGSGALQDARRIAPIVSSGTTPYRLKLYGDSASYNLYSVLPTIQNTLQNPLLIRENTWDKYIGRETRMVGSVYADWNLTTNLNLRSTIYGDFSWVNSTSYNPLYAGYNPADGKAIVVNPITRVAVSEDRYNKWQQDHILTYKKSFGAHGLTATAGFTTYFFGANFLRANTRQDLSGDPIPNDKTFWYIDNGFNDPSSNQSSSDAVERTTVSGLFRVLYNYQSKYMLNVSYRRDGSSVFKANGNTWDNFWAVGAAWEISKEKFMDDQNFFNFLKLKASIGVLGGQNTYGYDYPLYPRLAAGNSAVFGTNIYTAYVNDYTPDPNLHWEKNHAKEIGVEFNTLKNKLHVELNYYDRLTKGSLAFLMLPSGKFQLGNYGDISNKGIEALATWTHMLTRDLSFSISGNITTFKNEVKAFGTPLAASEQTPNQTEVGYPIGYFYGYIVDGVYQSYADKLGSPKVIGYEYGPGDLKYRDVNGDGKIDTKDRTMIGNPTPDFIYGGSVSLGYKQFTLDIDVNGSYGADVYRIWGSSELPYSRYNYASFKLNRWHGAGTSNWVPILGDNHAINRLPSTFGIEDGSYFRIRNVQLAYTFNPAGLSKMHIKSLRVFANVQNLKTFKNNSGYTPEFGGSPTAFGLDYGDGPVPMIVTGGINVNF
ncbi:MAG TPA: SusC/RagA family TonB-linked outer membrane protein, partial [Chitinophagaceae bacterium]